MGKAAEIQILKEFDPEIFKKCRAIDEVVFKPKYVKSYESECAIICKNSKSRIVVWHDGELVGYTEYLPLTAKRFDTFTNTRDTVFDLLMTDELVSPSGKREAR